MGKLEKGNVKLDLMDEDKLAKWVEQAVTGTVSDLSATESDDIALSAVNLADITSVISYMIRIHNQELYQALMSQSRDISVLKNALLENTDLTTEDIKEYEKAFDEKVELGNKINDALQKMNDLGEDATEEDIKSVQEELAELKSQYDE